MCFCFGKVLLVSQNWSSTCLKWEHDWDEDADALTGQGDGNRPCVQMRMKEMQIRMRGALGQKTRVG